MKIVAYLYSDPLLEAADDPEIWGWEVDRVYQDVGTRSQLDRLLKDCETEPVNYLLVRRLDELGDSLDDISDRIQRLSDRGVEIVAIETSPDSSKTAPFALLQAMQSRQHSRRIRQGHARTRLKAKPPPGKAPYGYRRGQNRYLLDRSTAPIVKEFFENFLLYGSLRGAVRHLRQTYGKKISVSTGQRWLTNPVYRGDLAYQNGEILSDTHEAILSREEAAQIDRLLRRNRRLPPRTASAPRSLAGLVVCGECQSPMTVTRVTQRGKQKDYLYLRPTACSRANTCRAIAYETILQQAIEDICRELPAAVTALELPDMGRIKQGLTGAIAAKQQILAQLPDLIETGVLDRETADLRAYKVRTEISTLKSQLAQLPPVDLRATAQAVSLPQFWLDLSEAERRFYFREFLQRIRLQRQGDEWTLALQFIFN